MGLHKVQKSQQHLNAVFNVFAHHRRWDALRELLRYEKPMALADLADEIAVQEKETTLKEIPADEVKQIYMSLYHRHIPELSEAGFVRYDQERDIVTLTEEENQIEQYQEILTVK